MILRLSKAIFLTTVLLQTTVLSGQRILDTQYFFGNSNFNFVYDKNGREPLLEERMVAPFGSSGSGVISDQFNGNLLFYSDGVQVFDQSHQLVAGFSTLSGDSSINQPVVVAPNPSAANNYFIFTNSGPTGPNEIQYSEINGNLPGNSSNGNFPFGVMTSVNTTTGLDNPSEGMIVLERRDGESYWLITQNRINFNFRATLINRSGIDSTRTFNLIQPDYPGAEASQFSFNEDSSLLAVAPKTPNRNVLILDFDRVSGTLSYNQQIIQTGFDDGLGESMYDVEWSNSGSKLYMSRFGTSSTDANIYQFDFDSGGGLSTILPNSIFRSYGLKRGLDDNILHLYQAFDGAPFNLGRMLRTDSIADSVQYETVVLDADFNGKQFPAFAHPNFPGFQNFAFTQFDICQNQTTKFYPLTDTIPSSYLWDFGDGNFSNSPAPVHTYDAPGGYPVTLTLELNGRFSPITQFVEILASDFMVDLGNDTTICVDEILTLDAGEEGIAYTWSTGATSQTIDVDTTGTYWVEVLSPAGNGCTAVDVITVTEYGIQRNLANQWYFGEMAGLDFNQTPPVAIVDENLMDSPEGCATISDSDGSLLFYTNGRTVWNKDHQVMVNGDSLVGDSTSAQAALILPFPDDETLFYLFTTEEVYGDFENTTRVSIIDIKDDTARGSVVIKSVKLFDFSTERLTATNFGADGWMMGHEFGNNNFRVNPITDTGIGATVHTPIGEFLNFLNEETATSYLRFFPGITRAANMIPGVNTIDILDFDNAEGVLSNPRNINTEEPANTPLYGIEFSGDGSKMYVTTTSTGTSKLIQYDLDSLDTDDEVAEIEATKYDAYATGAGYGALQRGPNGTIYMAVDNSPAVLSIDQPSGNDDEANFNTTGTDLMGRISRLGLPNFTQRVNDPTTPPGFTVESACFGQPLNLIATGTSNIDEFEWTFDEDATPQAGVGDSISVTYNTLGTHTITLRIFNRCGFDSLFVEDIEVFTIPENPTVPDNVPICDTEAVLEAWPVDDPSLSFYWSTGETSRSISVTSPAIINVAIINSDGCPSDTLEVFVGPAIEVDLGGDQSYCQDESVNNLDAQNAVGVFNWTIDSEPASDSRFQTVDTSVPGTYNYELEYIEEVTGCIARDSASIVVFENPTARVTATPPTACDTDDGAINFSIDSNGSFVYNLSGQEFRQGQTFDGPGSPAGFTNLGAGAYSLNIQNIVSGCRLVDPVQVEDNAPFDLSAIAVPDCGDGGDLRLEITGLVPASVNVTITDDEGVEVRSLANAATPVEDFLDFDTGLYIIQIEEVGGLGCIQIDSVDLGEAFPQSNFTFTPIQELCGTRDQAEITAGTNGTATYTWFDSDGDRVGIGELVEISFAGTYTVFAEGEGLCPRSEEIDININPIPDVEIGIEGDLCFGDVTLTALVDSSSMGPFNYQWLFGSERIEIFQTRSIAAEEEGIYQVRIIDPTVGCDVVSNSVDIDCEPKVRAPNAFSPNENGDNEFFFVFPNDFVDNYEIFIYSRWGELVFFSDDLFFRWNGEFRNKLLPDGTYAYVMKFTSLDEPELGVIEQYGSVTLIR